ILRDERGRIVRMIGGMLDVTAQRLTDERLRNVQKLDAVGSLTAGIAHNFNNMLAVILPTLELAQRDAEPEQRALLEDAVQAAQRASELVAQLMTFAGQRRGSAAKHHDLSHVLERAITMCRRTFDRRLRIQAAIEVREAYALCDATAVEQVLLNLLINA